MFIETTPPTVLVDFNMTQDGVVPALRSRLTGLVPDRLFVGSRIRTIDHDGNTADAVVQRIAGDVLDLYLLPAAPVELVSMGFSSTVIEGQIEIASLSGGLAPHDVEANPSQAVYA